MTEQDRLLEAQKLFQTVRSDAEMQDVSQITPCGKTCVPLILQNQAIAGINKRLEVGDRALDAIPLLVEEMRAIRTNSETMMKDMASTKADVASTKVDIAATKDVVEAWGRIVGTAKVMKGISTAIKVATPIVLFFGFVYLLFYNPQLAFEKARLWMGTK